MSEDRRALVKSSLVHDGRVVHLSVDTVRFPDGSVGELELVRHRGASAVLPIFGNEDDPDPDVLLIRQYRYAAGGVIYEAPAGIAEPGEDWETCARREIQEEAGVRAARLVHLTTIHTTPGFTNERIRLYAAFDLTPAPTARDADEHIDTVRMPLSRALELARTGEMTDAKSLVALLHAARFLLGRPARGAAVGRCHVFDIPSVAKSGQGGPGGAAG